MKHKMKNQPVVLLVEDDDPLRRSLAQWLELNDFAVIQASGSHEALRLLATSMPDVILSDVRMRGMDGLALLATTKKQWPDLPVVLLSGHGDVPMAVSAIQAGAFNFLTKPYVPEQLIGTLANAAEQARLQRRVKVLESTDSAKALLESAVVGEDISIVEMRRLIGDLALYPLDVLILGETGTGKEVVARALHDCSDRRNNAFVAINCAAIPADIFESELFGHDVGAFTGASGARTGKFEFANKGTVFLDEIESMPLNAQAKLLRVLQERQITRLGSNKVIPIDVRIVSATKFDLVKTAAEGRFRDDLYYRLMGAEIRIPPLRDRGNDSLLLFQKFAAAMAARMDRPQRLVSTQDASTILRHLWPGNVRQLKLLAERFALNLPWEEPGKTNLPEPHSLIGQPLQYQVAAFERSLIEAALSIANSSVSTAAEHLSLPHRTLNDKIKRLGIRLQGETLTDDHGP